MTAKMNEFGANCKLQTGHQLSSKRNHCHFKQSGSPIEVFTKLNSSQEWEAGEQK
jgi:hypothetical protein